MTSKQRPRKLTIHGSDGEDHEFLLKGHEDLRQDERVMQVIYLLQRDLLFYYVVQDDAIWFHCLVMLKISLLLPAIWIGEYSAGEFKKY